MDLTPEQAIAKLQEIKDKRRIAQSKYRETHREHVNSYRREWYERNKEVMRERGREYTRSYREKQKSAINTNE